MNINASVLIDHRIEELGDWRGKMIARLRVLVHEAAPEIIEEWKWDTPVWSQNGNVLAVGVFKNHIRINFFHGALLGDHHLFNAGLDAKTSRGIDLYEGDKIDEAALKELIRFAVDLNTFKPKPAKNVAKPTVQKKTKTSGASVKGGNELPKLGAPAQRALAGAGIHNLDQLAKFSEAEIKELHGVGPNALKELRRALKVQGLSFTKDMSP